MIQESTPIYEMQADAPTDSFYFKILYCYNPHKDRYVQIDTSYS